MVPFVTDSNSYPRAMVAFAGNSLLAARLKNANRRGDLHLDPHRFRSARPLADRPARKGSLAGAGSWPSAFWLFAYGPVLLRIHHADGGHRRPSSLGAGRRRYRLRLVEVRAIHARAGRRPRRGVRRLAGLCCPVLPPPLGGAVLMTSPGFRGPLFAARPRRRRSDARHDGNFLRAVPMAAIVASRCFRKRPSTRRCPVCDRSVRSLRASVTPSGTLRCPPQATLAATVQLSVRRSRRWGAWCARRADHLAADRVLHRDLAASPSSSPPLETTRCSRTADRPVVRAELRFHVLSHRPVTCPVDDGMKATSASMTAIASLKRA